MRKKKDKVRCYVRNKDFLLAFYLQCCKRFGHSGQNCNMDPNIKTPKDTTQLINVIDEESIRIQGNIDERAKKQKINKLGDFNKFVLHQLTTAQNIGKNLITLS